MAQQLPRGLRALYREVKPLGWTWEIRGSGHVMFHHPAGRHPVTAASSSNDVNQRRILLREMRRALEGGAP